MPSRIDTSSGRKALEPRREPYWSRVEAGAFVGFRKLGEGEGTWIARWRDDTGKQRYQALGHHDHYDSAVKASRRWFDQCREGAPDVVDVAEACRRYVEDRRREKGEDTATDAAGRFRRHVYQAPIGKILLHELRASHLTDWRNGLVDIDEDEDDPDAERRAKDSANRDLATLKAALNLAYRMGLVSATAAWDRVQSFHKVAQRRERFITVAERRKLLAAASPELTRLLRALLLTASRPGEIARARVENLDAAGLLTLQGKTGRRTIPLSPDALKHFEACAGKRPANAPLVARDDGTAWRRDQWRDAMQETRLSAGLDEDVVLYTLRHAAITEMLVGGLDPLTVARIAGTSVAMIQKHYGHLVKDGIVAKLAAVKMI